jgi:hypothetical protein
MPIKEGLVNSYVLDGDNAFVRVHFEDPVNKEKRIPMR